MTEINIEYCVPCGLREYAVETQETLLDEFGRDLDGMRLQPGHGSVFEIHADKDLVWDKDEYDGEINLEAITEAVHDRAHAHACESSNKRLHHRPMLELCQSDDSAEETTASERTQSDTIVAPLEEHYDV